MGGTAQHISFMYHWPVPGHTRTLPAVEAEHLRVSGRPSTPAWRRVAEGLWGRQLAGSAAG